MAGDMGVHPRTCSPLHRLGLGSAVDQPGDLKALGYAGTTISAIAATAGVSVPTVELAFGTKAALLKAAIDVAIAGDDDPVPVLERPWATQVQQATTAEEFLAKVADVLVEAAGRADALVLVAFEAARSDERLTPLAAQLKAQRSVTAAWIVDGLTARAPLRANIDARGPSTPSGCSWTPPSSTGLLTTAAGRPNATAPGSPTRRSDSWVDLPAQPSPAALKSADRERLGGLLPRLWRVEELCEEELDALLEKATIDAYGDNE